MTTSPDTVAAPCAGAVAIAMEVVETRVRVDEMGLVTMIADGTQQYGSVVGEWNETMDPRTLDQCDGTNNACQHPAGNAGTDARVADITAWQQVVVQRVGPDSTVLDKPVWDTEVNVGVLIYVLLADRAVEIVADRGLRRHVPEARWQALAQGLGQAFAQAQVEAGLATALAEVDRLLCAGFARTADSPQPNELPDAPVLR